ncbi:HDOD domain-containing protein [Aromatoleum buckelii]|uniref:HDOD domain-containing protein n=1 Tax=Aromatoleum buckelii TaxID=200254 RepID=A0ABX1N124_9RHOO|nr:HDOD domain-containing protein [Aromatoleum buckelii]MCK0512266.1 HDOD domain-containing protein [Aromatoleum buckelii]
MANDVSPQRFLIQIADDLSSGDITFPTFLDAAMKIRTALDNPMLTVDELARVIGAEPLVSAKVIRLANSAALNFSGNDVCDVRSAVIRVGFSAIRALAISVAIEQLMLDREMAPYASKARRLWEHSLDVATLSFVIARKLTRFNPHEAMFAGLVHDVGYFYLLSRVARHPGVAHEDDLSRLLSEWHAAVGHAVLGALDAPDAILDAISGCETAYEGDSPATLANVLHLANRLSTHPNPFSRPGETPATQPAASIAVAEIVAESRDERNSLMSALGQ